MANMDQVKFNDGDTYEKILDGINTNFDSLFQNQGQGNNGGDTPKDGVSPTVAITNIQGGHRITITDKDGAHSFDVMDGKNGTDGSNGKDGKNGTDGSNGADGISPTVSITDIQGGHRVTFTDKTGDHSFNVINGTDGAKGERGTMWIPGSGTPSDQVGVVGDFYLDSTTGNYYEKMGASWELKGNLKGPQGDGASAKSDVYWVDYVEGQPLTEEAKAGLKNAIKNKQVILVRYSDDLTYVSVKNEVTEDGDIYLYTTQQDADGNYELVKYNLSGEMNKTSDKLATSDDLVVLNSDYIINANGSAMSIDFTDDIKNILIDAQNNNKKVTVIGKFIASGTDPRSTIVPITFINISNNGYFLIYGIAHVNNIPYTYSWTSNGGVAEPIRKQLLTEGNIADDLTTTYDASVLSAKQGKVLNEKIDLISQNNSNSLEATKEELIAQINKLTEMVNGLISGAWKVEKVDELPATGKTMTLYMVPKKEALINDFYDEYIWDDDKSAWEQWGSAVVDFSNYYTKDIIDGLLANKIDKVDSSLQTSNKDIIQAINELKATIASLEPSVTERPIITIGKNTWTINNKADLTGLSTAVQGDIAIQNIVETYDITWEQANLTDFGDIIAQSYYSANSCFDNLEHTKLYKFDKTVEADGTWHMWLSESTDALNWSIVKELNNLGMSQGDFDSIVRNLGHGGDTISSKIRQLQNYYYFDFETLEIKKWDQFRNIDHIVKYKNKLLLKDKYNSKAYISEDEGITWNETDSKLYSLVYYDEDTDYTYCVLDGMIKKSLDLVEWEVYSEDVNKNIEKIFNVKEDSFMYIAYANNSNYIYLSIRNINEKTSTSLIVVSKEDKISTQTVRLYYGGSYFFNIKEQDNIFIADDYSVYKLNDDNTLVYIASITNNNQFTSLAKLGEMLVYANASYSDGQYKVKDGVSIYIGNGDTIHKERVSRKIYILTGTNPSVLANWAEISYIPAPYSNS